LVAAWHFLGGNGLQRKKGWGKSIGPMPDQISHQSDDNDSRRRRLLWRANHRGIKEMDLILGGFATRHLPDLDEEGLNMLEAIVALPDQSLLNWVTGQAPVPQEHASSLLLALLDFRP
jgi:antitoxin CptB